MKRNATLAFPVLPVERGRLLTPEAVAELIGGVTTAWVRRKVPGKLRLGQRTLRWYERDVLMWLDQQRVRKEEGTP